MWTVLRLLYGIWEALDENEGCHHFRPELVVLRNRDSQWETIMKGIVKFDDVRRVSRICSCSCIKICSMTKTPERIPSP